MAQPTNFGGVSALADGLLVAVFLYWGWDTATSVNEECKDSNTTPGLAGVISTFVLVLIYVIVAYRGAGGAAAPDFLSQQLRRRAVAPPATSCSASSGFGESRSSC